MVKSYPDASVFLFCSRQASQQALMHSEYHMHGVIGIVNVHSAADAVVMIKWQAKKHIV